MIGEIRLLEVPSLLFLDVQHGIDGSRPISEQINGNFEFTQKVCLKVGKNERAVTIVGLDGLSTLPFRALLLDDSKPPSINISDVIKQAMTIPMLKRREIVRPAAEMIFLQLKLDFLIPVVDELKIILSRERSVSSSALATYESISGQFKAEVREFMASAEYQWLDKARIRGNAVLTETEATRFDTTANRIIANFIKVCEVFYSSRNAALSAGPSPQKPASPPRNEGINDTPLHESPRYPSSSYGGLKADSSMRYGSSVVDSSMGYGSMVQSSGVDRARIESLTGEVQQLKQLLSQRESEISQLRSIEATYAQSLERIQKLDEQLRETEGSYHELGVKYTELADELKKERERVGNLAAYSASQQATIFDLRKMIDENEARNRELSLAVEQCKKELAFAHSLH